MRPDKAKVVDEVWDDARIESFLEKENMGTESDDFSRLLHAYRSMRVEDFERFLSRFKAQGGDPSAKSSDGRSLSEIIGSHRKAEPFLRLLNA